MTVAALVLVVHLAAADMPRSPAGLPRSPASQPADAPAMLAALGDPDPSIRQQMHLTVTARPGLTSADLMGLYRAAGHEEARLNLRQLAETLHHRESMAGQRGFLGVRPRVVSGIWDPRGGQVREALLLVDVLAGFPAAAAGLRSGDLLLELDGRPLEALPAPVGLPAASGGFAREPRADAFLADISRREPGERASVRILRSQGPAKLRWTPAQAAELCQSATLRETVVVPVGSSVTSLGSVPLPTALLLPSERDQPGRYTAIMAVQGQAVQPGLGVALLEEHLQAIAPNDRLKLEAIVLTDLQIEVVVGGRPVDRMNPLDLHISRQRFAQWWQAGTAEPSIIVPDPNPSLGIYSPQQLTRPARLVWP